MVITPTADPAIAEQLRADARDLVAETEAPYHAGGECTHCGMDVRDPMHAAYCNFA